MYAKNLDGKPMVDPWSEAAYCYYWKCPVCGVVGRITEEQRQRQAGILCTCKRYRPKWTPPVMGYGEWAVSQQREQARLERPERVRPPRPQKRESSGLWNLRLAARTKW